MARGSGLARKGVADTRAVENQIGGKMQASSEAGNQAPQAAAARLAGPRHRRPGSQRLAGTAVPGGGWAGRAEGAAPASGSSSGRARRAGGWRLPGPRGMAAAALRQQVARVPAAPPPPGAPPPAGAVSARPAPAAYRRRRRPRPARPRPGPRSPPPPPRRELYPGRPAASARAPAAPARPPRPQLAPQRKVRLRRGVWPGSRG